MPTSEVNGVRLYHEEHGAGAPILCVHGTSGSALTWRASAIESLAALGRVILYDRRGSYRSERPEPYTTSVAEQTDDAAALLETLTDGPAVVLGRSYGGAIAIDLAIRHPARVRALVLMEPALLSSDPAAERLAADVRVVLEAAERTDPASVAEAFLGHVLGPGAWATFPDDLRAMFRSNGPAILAEERGPQLELDEAQLARIAVPTLVVGGADSAAGFRRVNERVAAAIPGARSLMVEGGHLIDPADPRIVDFVADVISRGG